MKKFAGLIFLLSGLSAQALEVSQMGVKIDPNHARAPELKMKSNEILGVCDGHPYTSQAELDGCQRNVSARSPNTYISGQSRLTNLPRPVPTTEVGH